MFDPRPPATAHPSLAEAVPKTRSAKGGIVLGIDPGLSRCGYGAIERSGGTLAAVAVGVIRTDRHEPIESRLATLQVEIEGLLDDLDPSAVAVERVLFQVNVRTAMSVGQASGIALAAAARRGIPVASYSPNEMKLAVTGDGGADKRQVQTMVTRLLRLDAAPEPPDAADALGLALCHCQTVPYRHAIADATRRERTARDASASSPGVGGSRLAAAIDAAQKRDRNTATSARGVR